MIMHLSEWAKRKPQAPFFCVQGDRQSIEYSFRRAHIAAAALARELERHGMSATGTLACTMYNGAELVLLSLAAAYGGYTLALLNPRLSPEERQLRSSLKTQRASAAWMCSPIKRLIDCL